MTAKEFMECMKGFDFNLFADVLVPGSNLENHLVLTGKVQAKS